MTGIDSYSTTPANNATCDAGAVNWAEGQSPSSVNNTARQQTADTRAAFNDLVWFQYGTGDQNTSTHLAVPAVYASSTSFTIAGADVTTVYHANRRVRAVGVSTGTIYGTISGSSYSPTTTTVTVVWDSGSLSNETLVVSLSQIPATGKPIPIAGLSGLGTGVATLLGQNSTGTNGLVGKNAPTFTGTVNGTNASFNSGADFSYTYVANAASSSGIYYFMQFGGGTNGSISNNGSVTTYATTSDARLKNWQDFPQTDKRAMIDALWVGDFEWKESKAPGFGVIAQQAYEIMGPVSGIVPAPAELPDRHWIAPSEPFGFLALWGTKDQYAMIAALEARIAALEAQISG